MAKAQAGDRIIVGEGRWHDVQIDFIGSGSQQAPIHLQAAKPGQSVFTGSSRLNIAGDYLVVDGLCFEDPDPAISDLIQFRQNSKRLSHACRLTNCSVVNRSPRPHDSPNAARESRWVGLYGTGHRVDHCSFQGKSGKGATFVVWLGGEQVGEHRIDHNYFGPRERLGENGGETIRIGDSQTSMLSSRCTVESNLFERCNGETECISNKSCDNIYRDNTFLEVSGTLTLRHGNSCLVERNLFLGKAAKGTGGIRVIGEDHIVRGNQLERLTGDDARAAICLMIGVPDSAPNEYFQVKRARIENNTIIDCQHSILIGLADHPRAVLSPQETLFSGNQVICAQVSIIEARCELSGIAWEDNRMHGKSLGIPLPSGIHFTAGDQTSELERRPLMPLDRGSVGTRW